MKTLIAFRGNNTDNILQDAYPTIGDVDRIIIVARDGDRLAQPGDLNPLATLQEIHKSDEVALIANGGTTAQIMPLLVFLLTQYAGHCRIFDVQRDGVVLHYQK
jgi:hypothetical protein